MHFAGKQNNVEYDKQRQCWRFPKNPEDPPITLARMTTKRLRTRERLLSSVGILKSLQKEGGQRGRIITDIGHFPKPLVTAISRLAGTPIPSKAIVNGLNRLSKHWTGDDDFKPFGDEKLIYIDGFPHPIRILPLRIGLKNTVIQLSPKIPWVLKVFHATWTDSFRQALRNREADSPEVGGAHDTIRNGLWAKFRKSSDVAHCPYGSLWHGWVLQDRIGPTFPSPARLAKNYSGPPFSDDTRLLRDDKISKEREDVLRGPDDRDFWVDLEDL